MKPQGWALMQLDWCPHRKAGYRYTEKRPGEDAEGRMLSGAPGERPWGEPAPQHLGLGLPSPRKEREASGARGGHLGPAPSRSSAWGGPGA